MVNLIAGKEVVPELVQHDFTAAKVASCVETILADGPARQRMLEGLAQVRTKLGGTRTAIRPRIRQTALPKSF